MHSNIINTLTFRVTINLFGVHLSDCQQGICLLYTLFVFFLLFLFNFGLHFFVFNQSYFDILTLDLL